MLSVKKNMPNTGSVKNGQKYKTVDYSKTSRKPTVFFL
jgi:hypothetical protein